MMRREGGRMSLYVSFGILLRFFFVEEGGGVCVGILEHGLPICRVLFRAHYFFACFCLRTILWSASMGKQNVCSTRQEARAAGACPAV